MMDLRATPAYYAVIPPQIRYDVDLPPIAKIIYSELFACASANRCCTITNQYLAETFKISERRAEQYLKSLETKKYIVIDTTENQRQIFL